MRGGSGEHAGRHEHEPRHARIRRERLHPPTKEVRDHRHDGAGGLPVAGAGAAAGRPQEPLAERGAQRGGVRVEADVRVEER